MIKNTQVMGNVRELPSSGVFKKIGDRDACVRDRSNLEAEGIINGNLHIEAKAKVMVSGIVKGCVVNDDSKVELTGIIVR